MYVYKIHFIYLKGAISVVDSSVQLLEWGGAIVPKKINSSCNIITNRTFKTSNFLASLERIVNNLKGKNIYWSELLTHKVAPINR